MTLLFSANYCNIFSLWGEFFWGFQHFLFCDIYISVEWRVSFTLKIKSFQLLTGRTVKGGLEATRRMSINAFSSYFYFVCKTVNSFSVFPCFLTFSLRLTFRFVLCRFSPTDKSSSCYRNVRKRNLILFCLFFWLRKSLKRNSIIVCMAWKRVN